MAQRVKNLPAMWETWGSIPGLGRSPGGGNSYPLQYSGLEKSMDQSMGSQRVGHDWVTFTFTFFLMGIEVHSNIGVDLTREICLYLGFFFTLMAGWIIHKPLWWDIGTIWYIPDFLFSIDDTPPQWNFYSIWL